MKNVAFGISAAALLLTTGSVTAAGLGGLVIANGKVVWGDWTGVYVGGHAGYGSGRTVDSLECEGAPYVLGSVSWLAGEGVGCEGSGGPPIALSGLANYEGARGTLLTISAIWPVGWVVRRSATIISLAPSSPAARFQDRWRRSRTRV